jgi:hypothetical protein
MKLKLFDRFTLHVLLYLFPCGFSTQKGRERFFFYRVLVVRPEGKRPLGRPRRRWEDNIKMNFRDIGIDGANWIRLAQDRVQWRAFVNTVMNFRVPQESRIFFNS